MLRQYVDEAPQKIQEHKLRSQLFDAQAKHLEADSALKTMEMQKQLAYMQDVKQQLAQGMTQQPQQPSYEQEPGFQGPTLPQPIAQQSAGTQSGMTVGQLHDTSNFASPDIDERLLTIQGRAAARAGMVKEATQIQQALLELSKGKATKRTQELQDKLGMLQTIAGNLPPVPEFAKQREAVRQAMAATMFELGKTNDGIQFLEGKILALQPGGSAVQVKPGESQGQIVAQSPVNPAQLEASKEQARMNVRTGQNPLSGNATAGDVANLEEGSRLNAQLGRKAPQPGKGAVSMRPQPTQQAAIAQDQAMLIQQLMTNDPSLSREQAARAVQGIMSSTLDMGPLPIEGPAVELTRKKAEAEQKVQGLQPSNPANPVVGQKQAAERKATQIPREAAEQLQVPLGTTYGDLESGNIKSPTGSNAPKQLPSPKEREDIAAYDTTLQASNDLLKMIETNPKAAELLGSFLVNPRAALKRAAARWGAQSDHDARAFLAEYGVTAALLRSKLIGLAQTNREMSGLIDFVPGPEAGADAIKAGLKAIIKTTTRQRDSLTGVQSDLGVKTPTEKPKQGPASTPAPKAEQKETTQQMLDRLKAKGFGKK